MQQGQASCLEDENIFLISKKCKKPLKNIQIRRAVLRQSGWCNKRPVVLGILQLEDQQSHDERGTKKKHQLSTDVIRKRK